MKLARALSPRQLRPVQGRRAAGRKLSRASRGSRVPPGVFAAVRAGFFSLPSARIFPTFCATALLPGEELAGGAGVPARVAAGLPLIGRRGDGLQFGVWIIGLASWPGD